MTSVERNIQTPPGRPGQYLSTCNISRSPATTPSSQRRTQPSQTSGSNPRTARSPSSHRSRSWTARIASCYRSAQARNVSRWSACPARVMPYTTRTPRSSRAVEPCIGSWRSSHAPSLRPRAGSSPPPTANGRCAQACSLRCTFPCYLVSIPCDASGLPAIAPVLRRRRVDALSRVAAGPDDRRAHVLRRVRPASAGLALARSRRLLASGRLAHEAGARRLAADGVHVLQRQDRALDALRHPGRPRRRRPLPRSH